MSGMWVNQKTPVGVSWSKHMYRGRVARMSLPFGGDVSARRFDWLSLCVNYDTAVVCMLEKEFELFEG